MFVSLSKVAMCAVAATFVFSSTSCSIFLAANQPTKKDVSVLKKGTPRNHVIAELGKPVHTEGPKTALVDTFSFEQGYSTANKAGRVALHTAGNVLTGGLWEVVGTTTEVIADGTEIKAEVSYDADAKVKKVKAFSGAEKLGEVL